MHDLVQRMTFAFVFVGMLVSIALGIRAVRPKWQDWQEHCAEQEALQSSVDDIRQQITQTKGDINRFRTSPYFVERLARKNHRVADNEIVLIFD